MSQTDSIDTSDGDALRDLRHVQARLSLRSRSALYELLDHGLPSVKLGRRRMVRESDLSTFIASLGE